MIILKVPRFRVVSEREQSLAGRKSTRFLTECPTVGILGHPFKVNVPTQDGLQLTFLPLSLSMILYIVYDTILLGWFLVFFIPLLKPHGTFLCAFLVEIILFPFRLYSLNTGQMPYCCDIFLNTQIVA